GARADNGLGHDQVALGEVGSERAADAGRDDQRRRRSARARGRGRARGAGPPPAPGRAARRRGRPGPARVEVRGPRAGAEELERAAAEVRPRAPPDALEAELTGQTTGLELNGRDDEDAGHASLSGVRPESFSAWPAAFAASLARSHAA